MFFREAISSRNRGAIAFFGFHLFYSLIPLEE